MHVYLLYGLPYLAHLHIDSRAAYPCVGRILYSEEKVVELGIEGNGPGAIDYAAYKRSDGVQMTRY